MHRNSLCPHGFLTSGFNPETSILTFHSAYKESARVIIQRELKKMENFNVSKKPRRRTWPSRITRILRRNDHHRPIRACWTADSSLFAQASLLSRWALPHTAQKIDSGNLCAAKKNMVPAIAVWMKISLQLLFCWHTTIYQTKAKGFSYKRVYLVPHLTHWLQCRISTVRADPGMIRSSVIFP
jgi:hypothetical protein